MSIAIQTRFIQVTNHRGARIVAETMADMPPRKLGGDDKPARLYASYAYRSDKQHHDVAKQLCVQLGWAGVYVSAGTDRGYVYVRLTMSQAGRLPALEAVDVAFVVSDEEAAPAVAARNKFHGL